MKYLKAILGLATIGILMIAPFTVRASDITTADYYATIKITNNSTAASAVSVNMSLSSADLISQNYVDTAFTRCAVRNSTGADAAFMPGYGTNPWIFFLDSIGAATSVNYILYTGPSNMNSKKYMMPLSMTIPDTMTEPSNNWSIVFHDVSLATTSTLLSKGTAINVSNNSSTGNLTVSGGFSKLPTSDGGVWTNPSYAYDGKISTSATSDIAPASWTGYLTLNIASTPMSEVYINSNRDSVLVNTQDVDVYYGGAWHNIFSSTPVIGWSTKAIGSTQSVTSMRTRFYNNSGVDTHSASVLEFWFGDSNTLSVAATQTEHTITLVDNPDGDAWITGIPSFGMQIDSGAFTTMGNIIITDVPTIWTFLDGTPYCRQIDYYVNGVLIDTWTWRYAATWTGTVTGNIATPVFRTTSSSANVSALLVDFQPIDTARAPAYAVSNAPVFITTNITTSGNFTSGNITSGDVPGSEVIDEAARTAGVQNIWLWGIGAMITMGFGSVGISWMTRKFGAGPGELIVRLAFGIFVFGVLIAFKVFDFWMLVLYLIIALAPAFASRHQEVGASVSELNFIGFLAQVWIGLTVISRIMQAQLLTAAETSGLNNLMFTQDFDLLGLFKVPIINANFFTEGLPRLLNFGDYGSLFAGNGQMIEYFLYGLTAVAGFIVFMITASMITSYFTRSR